MKLLVAGLAISLVSSVSARGASQSLELSQNWKRRSVDSATSPNAMRNLMLLKRSNFARAVAADDAELPDPLLEGSDRVAEGPEGEEGELLPLPGEEDNQDELLKDLDPIDNLPIPEDDALLDIEPNSETSPKYKKATKKCSKKTKESITEDAESNIEQKDGGKESITEDSQTKIEQNDAANSTVEENAEVNEDNKSAADGVADIASGDTTPYTDAALQGGASGVHLSICTVFTFALLAIIA